MECVMRTLIRIIYKNELAMLETLMYVMLLAICGLYTHNYIIPYIR